MSVLFGLLGLLVVAYLIFRVEHSPTARSPLVDGWLVDAFELTVSGLCLAAARNWPRHSAIPRVLGAAFLFVTAGSTALTLEGANPPSPTVADVFYLCFYPLAYVGLVMMMRRDTGSLVPSAWLDGVVAALGVAAICACFALKLVSSLGGSSLGVVVRLAYPLSALVLLAMVVGVTTTLGRRPGLQWRLLSIACLIVVCGDTFNLLATAGPNQVGSVIASVSIPCAMLLVAVAMWARTGPVNLLGHAPMPGSFLPGLGACGGLGILIVAPWEHPGYFALALAIATVLAAVVRFGLSARSLRALTEQRHRQALTDELTGLGNRRLLFTALDAFFFEQSDPRNPRRSISFLYIDLDHFKQINDTFGHSSGDELLRQLGPRIRGALRSTDLVVRLGGDELAAVVVDTDPATVLAVAQRLMSKVKQPFLLDQVVVRVNASIGVASAPSDATDSATLVRCADLAMYRAKRSESAIETYRNDLDSDGSQMSLVGDLWAAVELGAFTLQYQPQLSLRTGRISSVEALLRWHHPRLGQVPPLDFIPLAEEAGLMGRLTAWVLDQALAQCAAWMGAGRQITVAVNVSVTNLLDPEFLTLVQQLLLEHRVPASSLIIEITETTVIRDFEASREAIAQMRGLGVSVSVDDFGAGFTSLAYLADLEFSELKLDQSFITRLSAGRQRDLALVGATIELAHALQLQVVAEGIEDLATLNLLSQVGCDLAQGYYIGRPVNQDRLRFESHEVLTPSDYQLAQLRAS